MSDSPLLADLNPAQRAAITAPDGPTLILAGPGSGKTRVLTHRIAYLVGQRGLPPFKIMAVTFTNRAAREMRARVEKLLGGDLRGLWMGTFHAICARLLRREADHLPITADYVIYDDDDQRALIKAVITQDLRLDDKLYRPESILSRISQAKNEMITPDLFEPSTHREEIVRRAYEAYQRRLVANNAVDFDDLLLHAAALLASVDAVRARYQHTLDHVLVDEFQDTNTAQYRLVRLLSGGRDNLFCVGDEDQSVYSWRGADWRNVHRLRQDYPNLNVILLEQNYRSTQTILDAATALIDHNPNRTPKKLFTEAEGGVEITLYEAHNETYEAQFVVDTIAGLVASHEVEPGQCAVMYRTNAQSRVLEEAFLRAGLPYRLVGATRFYGRREIRDLLAYLRIIHNPEDSVSLLRVINIPPRGIGDKTLEQLSEWAANQSLSLFGALTRLADGAATAPFTPKARAALVGFTRRLAAWRAVRGEIKLGDLVRQILNETGYQAYIDDGTDDGAERWGNVVELVNLTAEYEELDLATFLEEAVLVADVDTLDDAANAPALMTLHAAKGLEFDVVFVTGIEENILPHQRSRDDGEALAEERRLLYVGMTRARKRLYLLHAFQRTTWGQSELNQPSRFLEDIPEHLLATQRRGYAASFREVTSWAKGPAKVAAAERAARPAGQFKAGQRVVHIKFGPGLVIESKPSGDDEEVSVVFDTGGLKRLLASFANLTKADE